MGIHDQTGRSRPIGNARISHRGKANMKPVLLALSVSGLVVLGAGLAQRGFGSTISSLEDTALPNATATQRAPNTSEQQETALKTGDSAVDGATKFAQPRFAETKPIESGTSAGTALVSGDHLKLAFYERVALEDDKWGRASSVMRSIVQRPEISGEYTVQEDGTLSVPLLGSVTAAGRSPQQLTAALTETFEQVLGHTGMVNIVSLERSPVYVLGPVKNAGSFKYASGMTVLHAVALAGGLDRGSGDSYQKIETVREIQKRTGAAGAMLKLMARLSVLKAERDGTAAPAIPTQLMEMVGASEARSLVDEQVQRRKPVLMARKERLRAIVAAVEAAKQDLLSYGRSESLDQLVKTRQERVDSTRGLVERNVLGKTVLAQVQAELSDAEQRRQDAANQFGMAKQRLASMEADSLKAQSDLKNDLVVEIDAIERQLADNEREFNTSEGVLSSMPATRSQFASARQASLIGYSIVRQTAKGPVRIESDGMTVLQPGDLVNVAVGAGESVFEPQPAPQAPPTAVEERNNKSPSGRSALRGGGVKFARE
jgi:polysaccharide biosynthesis/export protein ExoF